MSEQSNNPIGRPPGDVLSTHAEFFAGKPNKRKKQEDTESLPPGALTKDAALRLIRSTIIRKKPTVIVKDHPSEGKGRTGPTRPSGAGADKDQG